MSRALPVNRLLNRIGTFSRRSSLEGAVVLSQIFGATASLAIARALGASGRGTIATVALWGQLLGWMFSLSLDKAMVVEGRNTAERSANVLFTGARLTCILMLPGLAVSVAAGMLLFNGNVVLASALSGTCGMTVLWEFVAGGLLLYQRDQLFALYRLTQPLLYLLFALIVFVIVRVEAAIDPAEATYGLAVGMAISIGLPAALLAVKGKPRETRGKWSSALARRLAAFGMRTQIANSMQFLNGQLDVLALTMLTNRAAVGIYSVAWTISQLPVVLGSAAAIRGLTGELTVIDRRSLATSALVTSSIIVVGPLAIPAVFGPSFHGASVIADILSVGSIANYLLQSYSGILLGTGRPTAASIAQGIGVAVFLAGLVISHTLVGAAIASVCSSFVSAAVARRLCLSRPAQLSRGTKKTGFSIRSRW